MALKTYFISLTYFFHLKENMSVYPNPASIYCKIKAGQYA